MNRTQFLATALVLCSFIPLSLAKDTPQTKLESLVGDQLAAVAATTDTADDAVLAKKLLDMSSLITDSELKRLLYEKSYDLGLRDPAGFSTAEKAIQFLDAEYPDTKESCKQKLLVLSEYRYRKLTNNDAPRIAKDYLRKLISNADEEMDKFNYSSAKISYNKAITVAEEQKLLAVKKELTFRADLATNLNQIAQSLESLKKQNKDNPKDKEITEKITRILLVDLDNPVEAVSYIKSLDNPVLESIILLSVKQSVDLTDDQLLQLAKWYQGEAEKGGVAAKLTGYIRSLIYYKRYLTVHTKMDVDRLASESAVTRIENSVAALGERKLSLRQKQLNSLELTDGINALNSDNDLPPEPLNQKQKNIADALLSSKWAHARQYIYTFKKDGTYTLDGTARHGIYTISTDGSEIKLAWSKENNIEYVKTNQTSKQWRMGTDTFAPQ